MHARSRVVRPLSGSFGRQQNAGSREVRKKKKERKGEKVSVCVCVCVLRVRSDWILCVRLLHTESRLVIFCLGKVFKSHSYCERTHHHHHHLLHLPIIGKGAMFTSNKAVLALLVALLCALAAPDAANATQTTTRYTTTTRHTSTSSSSSSSSSRCPPLHLVDCGGGPRLWASDNNGCWYAYCGSSPTTSTKLVRVVCLID